MKRFFLVIALLATSCVGAQNKTNRTSCFQYIDCLSTIQTTLKKCAGGTAISLTMEAKDVNIRDLVKYRALEFVGCQDRLLKEMVDFESLQSMVLDDAHECFEKLPESSKRVEPFTDSCDYVQPLPRNTPKGDALQCLIEYKQDREYCESLLECCPDHTRCGERMNAVSLAYQNARVKTEQIVYNMISCVVSNDPRFMREGARLQALRDPYRNAGIPFLRPDAYTESRISRRLALTSTATLAQRRDRFLKKYSEVRQVVAQKMIDQYTKTTTTTTTTTTTPETPVEDVVSEVSETADEQDVKEQLTTKKEENGKGNDSQVQMIRELIRTASDKDLSTYVSLISEGKFGELLELANRKMKLDDSSKLDMKLHGKMDKIKTLLSNALEKSSELEAAPEDPKVLNTRSSEKLEDKSEQDEKEKPAMEEVSDKQEAEVKEKTMDQKEALDENKEDKEENNEIPKKTESNDEEKVELTTEMTMEITETTEPTQTTTEMISHNEEVNEDKNTIETTSESNKEHLYMKEENQKNSTTIENDVAQEKSVVKPSTDIESDTQEKSTPSERKRMINIEDEEPEAKELSSKDRALIIEEEIKESSKKAIDSKLKLLSENETDDSGLVVDESPKLESDSGEKKEENEKVDVISEMIGEMHQSVLLSTTVAPQITATLKSELISNLDDVLTSHPSEEIEGSGEEDATTTTTTTESPTVDQAELISKVRGIRPHSDSMQHCQRYASCWQTIIDYEQHCDRKYSIDVLSHGIDDAEILSILQNSSISQHEIVLKACLRPLDRAVHSTLKQLLVIQRGVRKACLDLGRNKIALTDSEQYQCSIGIPSTAAVDEYLSSVHARSQENHMMCRAKLEPLREACHTVRGCCASVETCDNYIASSPVKKLETEAVRRLVKKQNDCEQKMLQTLSYIHEQLSSPSRRRRFYYH